MSEAEMDDLEVVKRCAAAEGIELVKLNGDIDMVHGKPYYKAGAYLLITYWPLTDDAQAMALVRKFPMECAQAIQDWADDWVTGTNDDLARAIALCVSQLAAPK